MKAFKIVSTVIVCLVILAAMIFINYGGLSTISFQIKKEGGETLVYQDMKGSYKNTGMMIKKISNELESQFQIETNKEFGLFFDDPRKVEKSKLRSEVGCFLEKNDSVDIFGLKSKFNVRVCPVKNYITAEFPYKGKVSIMIGLMKVYPALKEYVKLYGYTETGPVMEIYDMPDNKIFYRIEANKINM